ncbi:MAG: hypothetical protein ACKV2Q_17435 [Planctomycetaceae bacterium]
MSVQPKFSKQEHARLGTEIYERTVRPIVEADHHGEIVAIDIETGDFEVARQTLVAADQLRARRPEAQIWFVRVGHRALHRFGFWHRPEAQ